MTVVGSNTGEHLLWCPRSVDPSEPEVVPIVDALRAAMRYRWARRLLDAHLERLAAPSGRPVFASAPQLVRRLSVAERVTVSPYQPLSWRGLDVPAHERDELVAAVDRTRRVAVSKLSVALASAVCSQLRISAPTAPLERELLVFCPYGRLPEAKWWHVAAAVWGVSNGVLWVPGWTWPWFERKLAARVRPLSAQPFYPAEKLADPTGERLDRVAFVEVRDPHVAALAAELFAERPALGSRQAVRAAAAALS